MQSSDYRFTLGQRVTITVSGETGTVIGRAEYSTTPLKSYYLRLLRADGRASEEWWTEDALEPAEAADAGAAWPLPAETPVVPWRVETADGVPGYDVVSADGTLDAHFDEERDAQRRAESLNELAEVPA